MEMQHTFRITNGEQVKRTFSDAEMQSRLDKLRAMMAEQEVDAVLFTSMHNVHYYSDFLYCAFGRPYGLIVTQEKSTSISAGIDWGQPGRRTFGENITFTDWHRDNYFVAVKELIKDGMSVGVEYDHINIEQLDKLKAALPSSKVSDISKGTMFLRMIKSAEEIALIKEGARVGDIGGAACVEAIGVGVPEHEVALHATNVMVREIAKAHPDSEIRDTWVWFQSGINTDGAHNPVTTKKIESGDILSLNCFPMISGYYTALERTLFCESATDRELELWDINCEVHRHGLSLIKPGARCCDIAQELNEIYKGYDILQYRSFGYGHSFGVLSHYYGREAGLELREDIETVLEPGMVVSMEPMFTIPEGIAGAGGYREHDILVVGEDGAENITKFPFGKEHNIVTS